MLLRSITERNAPASILCKVLRNAAAVQLLLTRAAVSAATDRRPEVISSNLSFRRADASLSAEHRPIVIMYGWLAAKARHIHRYGDYYAQRGYDVLHIKIRPLQVMWPRRTHVVVDEILDFVVAGDRARQPLIVHGFSVGGYLYGETLCRLLAHEQHAATARRLCGQIFDSPVDMAGIPYGVSRALFVRPRVQAAVEALLSAYLRVLHAHTSVYYERASAAFSANRLAVPSLFLYSAADLIGAAGRIEELIAAWRRDGVSVAARRWQRSLHVSHFHRHPDEYVAALDAFLDDIGFARRSDAEPQGAVANA